MSAIQTAKQIVVVLGAGPGLGFSAAKKFAEQGHPVALLSRSKDNLEPLASQINAQSSANYGKALAYAVNAQDEPSIRATIKQIASDFESGKAGAQHQGARIHTGIFNPGGGFVMSGFLETKPSQVEEAFKTQVFGGFVFSQAILEAIISSSDYSADSGQRQAAGNILLTGATASLKGGPKFSAFASSKFGLRAIGQSLAREWGPKGVHVAHFIIDGVIASERIEKWLGSENPPGSRMQADDIAQVYLDTTRQPRSVWAFEVDLRPSVEKW